jgi:hypothetical protein
MKSKKICILLLILYVINVNAQTAETTSTSFYVNLNKENSEASITILNPQGLEELKRGLTPVRGKKIMVRGLITDKEGIQSAFINNYALIVNPDGTFNQEMEFKTGIQDLIISVLDKQNSATKKTYKIDIKDEPVLAGFNDGIGNYYALLIGVNDYIDPQLNDLDNPLIDANELKRVLTKYYYFSEENIVLLENATRRDIIDALDKLRNKVTYKDNLLIFYAGHGWWDERSEVGYWIPSDGRKTSTADWFGNSTLTDQLRSIESKHTLLIADACFSGGIFKTRTAFNDAPPAINKLYAMNSRKAMTSGTMTEVPDRSVFIKYLIKRLETNNEKYLASEQLFSSFRMAVINNSDVVPQYGTIQKVGDEGGDFIFIRRDD